MKKSKFTASDLIPNQAYHVITEFKDYDGIIHPVGESWRFVEKNFLPYEDGLSLFVEKDGQNVSFRLQWRPEAQGQIIDNFSNYVEEVK
ncbi:MAG: DUF3601 domain-containing protein [Anaerolineales bacterium]|nr:DUF3601 domain-containing protein [Anaerolineales bacterium]